MPPAGRLIDWSRNLSPIFLALVSVDRTFQPSLATLSQGFRLPYVSDLIARKVAGAEQSTPSDTDWSFHESEYIRLVALLEVAAAASSLPEGPSAEPALHDLLVRIRLVGSRS